MKERNAIGIDPDSQGFVCAYVKRSDTKVATRGYMATDSDLKSFLKWVKGEKDVVVAIEGSNGMSKPLEKALREAEVIFYSFKPADTDKFRKAVLGQNKNNKKDAESVARYAMALEAQGKLEKYRRVWFADMELQLLTRRYESLTQQLTAEVNRLWKLLRYASADLYLALGGKNPEVECGQKVVKSQGILNLLISTPDVGQWKSLSDEQMLEAMGGGRLQGSARAHPRVAQGDGQFSAGLRGDGPIAEHQRPPDPAAQGGAAGYRADAGEADRGERGGAGVAADEGDRDEHRGEDDRRDHRHQTLCP